MSLDEKRNVMYSDGKGLVESQYSERDVKQFIKDLKKYFTTKQSKVFIDKLAGKGLI